jgi:hypothetical protein
VDAGLNDGGIDTGSAEITGLGEYCELPEDCAGFDADYCFMDGPPPVTTGKCTVQNCKTTADCPPLYVCCLTPAVDFVVDVCITEDQFTEWGSMLCGK